MPIELCASEKSDKKIYAVYGETCEKLQENIICKASYKMLLLSLVEIIERQKELHVRINLSVELMQLYNALSIEAMHYHRCR